MTREEYWEKQNKWFRRQQDDYFRMNWHNAFYDIDWREIPIFIINRNRLSIGFTDLVNWLLYTDSCQSKETSLQRRAVRSKITVIDNGSTYPPLLQYYKDSGLHVQYMEHNGGPWVFWEKELYKQVFTPYIVTDADLAPDKGCPSDIIQKLLFILKSHTPQQIVKVGPGLRIDNLPDHYNRKDYMRQCEAPFNQEKMRRNRSNSRWIVEGTPDMFLGGIDTTFCMYRPGAPFVNGPNNYRLAAPYVFEHRPWYIDSSNPPEEDNYYRQHAENGWSSGLC